MESRDPEGSFPSYSCPLSNVVVQVYEVLFVSGEIKELENRRDGRIDLGEGLETKFGENGTCGDARYVRVCGTNDASSEIGKVEVDGSCKSFSMRWYASDTPQLPSWKGGDH